MKFIAVLAVCGGILFSHCLADPVALDKSSDDDMKTSETFGYGYYQQPDLYGAPLAGGAGSYRVGAYPAPPLATRTSLTASSSGYARSGSGYGYGSGYKYGGGYGYGSRYGYGSGGAANEFYRSHPVYVAWG